MAKEAPKLSKLFGYQQTVKGSLGFSRNNNLTCISGKKATHYKVGSNHQTFISIPEENKITAVGFGEEDLLIIASKGVKAMVGVFNLRTKEKKNLPRVEKIVSDSFVWVTFSDDNERIGGQGGPPDWGFALWDWGKRRLQTVFHPFRMEPDIEVYKFTFCPYDSKRIVAVGKHFFRAYFFKDEQRILENPLHDQERSDQIFHSVAWKRNPSHVMVGTSGGNILVFENMQLMRQVSITKELTRIQSSVNVDDKNVTCIILTSDGLICSHGTTSVLRFKDDFILDKILSGKDFEDNFLVLQDYQHNTSMICADTIQMFPLQASCSETTIIIMDYITGEVVLRNQLPAVPCSITLCSLGTSVAIGFEDAVRIYNVVNDSLVETISFKEASDSQVRNILWRHDNSLLSSDDKGTIYEWDIPRKEPSWKFVLPGIDHRALAAPRKDVSGDLYVASSDSKIRRIKNGEVMEDCGLNNVRITAMLATSDLLLAGSDTGKILGFLLPLRVTTFEMHCHAGSICHFAAFLDSTSIMVMDSYGIMSTWNFKNNTYERPLPSRNIVLIDIHKQEELIQNINEMEEKLRERSQISADGKALQSTRFQADERKTWEEYRKVQCSLRSTTDKLEEEIKVLETEFEKKHANNMQNIEKEKEEDEKYFRNKLAEEGVCLEQAKAERERSQQEFEREMTQLRIEKQAVIDEFGAKYSRHEDRVRELEDVLDNTDFSYKLQHDALELSVEGDQKIKECQIELEQKEKELSDIKQQLKQVMAAELLLERYRLEFVNSTANCPSATSLRWAILRLYEKRVVRSLIKEETLFFDTDPNVRFHNQRDHYESLINIVRSRTAQIKNTFRENFVKLAKENSDWTAFAEAIRNDIQLKKQRILYLEEGLGMKKEEFGRNPAETQRRLWQAAETLQRLEEEEERQIDKRLDLIEEQQKEILRLHGLLSVEEKGKIIRKMRL
ncbi:cilia-and flagella-associated protein 57 [Nephila pilipes]|uniref:Cilia-and flagella-associated protein 57 n=1 Tax=Nephila pilipes TaxID=299642 RepID=A0A8X6PL02_NEPPI|nr:cilia-and flagella-associated protein 57 [Nephila pilipes]